MNKRTYKATLERDEDGVWCGVVRLGPKNTAISDGPTIERCRERLREAVALAVDCDESEVEIALDVNLPEPARAALDAVEVSKTALVAAQRHVITNTATAVYCLERAGLSRRDVGSLLGVTRQRVSQMGKGTLVTKGRDGAIKKAPKRKKRSA